MSASKNQSECQNTAFLLVVLEFIEEGEFRCIVGLFRVVLGDFVRIRLGVSSGLFIEGPLRGSTGPHEGLFDVLYESADPNKI